MNIYFIVILLIIFFVVYKYVMSKKPFKDFLKRQSAIDYTILWVFLVVVIFPLMAYQSHTGPIEVDLSVLGAYLAGVAAPIAFIWLVLGYFQQSKQLKVNNETLEYQLAEFKHSVEAQLQLAENTHKQLDFLIQEKYYPNFELIEFQIYDDTIEFTIENRGALVKNITWNIDNVHLHEEALITKINDNDIKMNLLFENLSHIKTLDLRLMVSFNINYDQETRYLCYTISYKRTAFTDITRPTLVRVGCSPVE